ncbi:MAG: hypothetical protein ACRDFS_04845 [Chloroflexota bacterium]
MIEQSTARYRGETAAGRIDDRALREFVIDMDERIQQLLGDQSK